MCILLFTFTFAYFLPIEFAGAGVVKIFLLL